MVISFIACKKDEPAELGAKNIAEAELRLKTPEYWVIKDVIENGTFVIKDKIVLDEDYSELVSKLKFDTDKKKVYSIYVEDNGSEFSEEYDYTIEGDVFKVTQTNDNGIDEDKMTIKSGSVFSDHFTLVSQYEEETLEVNLVPKGK